MVKRVKSVDWSRYKKVVGDFIDQDAGRQPFIWLSKIEQPLAYGEDGGIRYCPVVMEGLFYYNFIKTWPNQTQLTSGELDLTNCVLYISAQLLRKADYLDKYGYWEFNNSEDRFVLNGKVYKPSGDTQVAQAEDEALLFFIILQREDDQETSKLLQEYAANESRVITNQGIFLIDSSGQKVRDACNNLIEVYHHCANPATLTQDCRILGYQAFK